MCLLSFFLLLLQTVTIAASPPKHPQGTPVGQFHFPLLDSRCLDLDDSRAVVSVVVLNECDPSVQTQLWRVDSSRTQITTLHGNKCLSIHQKTKDGGDDFINELIEATACKYVSSGRSSAKNQPNGFQKLIFANDTIIWRGQSKFLPADIGDRYCLEVVDSEEIGVTVALKYCIAGRQQQHFEFEDNNRRHF
jgi:hypothetical protein